MAKAQSSRRKTQVPKPRGLRRCITGIPRLDSALSGGIPSGSVVLLSGASGTGKTVLGMQWLFHGACNDEPGIYLTMTEPVTKLIRHASTLSFYDSAIIDKAGLVLEDLRNRKSFITLEKKKKLSREDINPVIDDIKQLVSGGRARRLVLDSVTAVCRFLGDSHLIRHFIFRLGTVLGYLNCTAVLISEVHDGGYSAFDVEEFISDGIIHLGREKVGDDVVRALEIVKMRGVLFSPGPHYYKITEDGIKFYGQEDFDLGEMPATRIQSGIPGLDKMLNGGIYRHTITMVRGSSGTGKSTFGLQFLLQGVKDKERVILFNYEEPATQIHRNVRESFGIDLKLLEKTGLFKLICRLPEELSILDHLDEIRRIVRQFKPTRVVVDSLSALEKALDREALLTFSKQLCLFLKRKGITSLFLSSAQTAVQGGLITETQLSTLPDNIILLSYVEIDSTMQSFIAVLKQRGSGHDKQLRQYVITRKGITIQEPFKGVQGVFSGNVQHTVDNKALLKAFSELSEKA